MLSPASNLARLLSRSAGFLRTPAGFLLGEGEREDPEDDDEDDDEEEEESESDELEDELGDCSFLERFLPILPLMSGG